MAKKLKDILKPNPFMKIVIDEEVSTDKKGNYLINVGYVRVSTDKQAEEGFGLDIQEDDIVRYCMLQKIKNLVLFVDDGYTGTNLDRPGLQGIEKMITDFNLGRTKNKVVSVIVAKIDRLSRTLFGTLEFIRDYIIESDGKSEKNLNEEDINFISVNETYCRVEKNNPQGKFLLMLFGTLAEFDRDLIVEKMNKGREQRVASGKWLGGGVMPYGYKYDSTLGTLVVIPEEAEKIKEVFRLYIDEGLSPGAIRLRLGFKNEKKVTNILQRKSLTGCIMFKGKEYKGLHEPIISLERWEEAQEEIKKRGVTRTTHSEYLLSGLVFCGECGARMRYQKWGKEGIKLRCYSIEKSPSKQYMVRNPDCDNLRWDACVVEDAVINEILNFEIPKDNIFKYESSAVNTMQILKNELKERETHLRRLYKYGDEETDDILLEEITKERKAIKNLKEQIEKEGETNNIKKKVTKAQDLIWTIRDIWYDLTIEQQKKIIKELVERIYVYKTGEVSVKLRLEKFFKI